MRFFGLSVGFCFLAACTGAGWCACSGHLLLGAPTQRVFNAPTEVWRPGRKCFLCQLPPALIIYICILALHSYASCRSGSIRAGLAPRAQPLPMPASALVIRTYICLTGARVRCQVLCVLERRREVLDAPLALSYKLPQKNGTRMAVIVIVYYCETASEQRARAAL
jgi:hypothetical protein